MASGTANAGLTRQLVARDFAARYRGSLLGVFWSVLTPLLMLAVFTFVFGSILEARWARPGGAGEARPLGEFAVIIFAGQILFQFFAEVANQAPGLIVANRVYVKKVKFPLGILPVVSLTVALIQLGINFLVLLVFAYVAFGGLPATVLLAPVVMAPLALMVLGLAWALAALGTYLRDVSQVIGALTTALMFLCPLFFPRELMAEPTRTAMAFNPLTIPVESLRKVALFGELPDFWALGAHAAAAVVIAGLGAWFFALTRRGFADVL